LEFDKVMGLLVELIEPHKINFYII
jgi:hypothetical protein